MFLSQFDFAVALFVLMPAFAGTDVVFTSILRVGTFLDVAPRESNINLTAKQALAQKMR